MTREEALNEIRSWAIPSKTAREVLETLVPELAESEDERIRRWLVDYFKSVGNSWIHRDISPEQILSYLEKQKYNRMQPVYDNQESFESALDKAWKSYNDSGARTVDGCEDNYTECAYAKGFREGYLFGLEKQKEPRWCHHRVDLSNCSEEYMKAYYDGWNNCNQQHSQCEAEQQPAEWSEEDKRKLNRIYEILGQAAYERPFGSSKRIIGDKEAVELQDFIKSLRPSWKPSEEQMEWLESAVKLSTDKPHIHGIIISLYEQLKRLM